MNQPFDSIEGMTAHYAALLAEHGDGPRAVGWDSPHVQMASFGQLAAADGMVPGARVLDVGCGLGAFKAFLDQRGLAVDYTGWDVCGPLIEAARARHPGVRFEVRDLCAAPGGEVFDLVVCSGALNLRLPDHEHWVRRMLTAMYARCRVGMVATLLSDRVVGAHLHAEPQRFYYVAPEDILTFCFTLSRQIVIDHCELAQAFAVYVYRNNTAPMARLAAAIAPGRRFGPGHALVAEHYESHGMFAALIDYLSALEPATEVWDRIGLAAFQLGDHERQRRAFERAVALAPDGPAAVGPLLHLAITYMDGGHHTRAAPLLERALTLAAGAPNAPVAANATDALVAANVPDASDIAFRLGRCRERLGQVEAARAAYRTALGRVSDHAGAAAALRRLDGAG
jgi:SAM-dependent methyltransferase